MRKKLFQKNIILLSDQSSKEIGELKLLNNRIKGNFQVGNVEKVNQLFESIKKPDNFTYSIMIKGMAEFNEMERVNQLFEESKKTIEPDVVLYSSYVQILSKNEDFEKIKEIIIEMKEKNLKPNAVFFGFVLSGLTKKNKLKEALYIYNYMKKNNYEINEYHISSIIKIYSNKTIYNMDVIFQFLKDSKIEPNLIIQNNLILAFSNRNLLLEGVKYLKSLKNTDEVSYNTLIVKLCKSKKIELALELFYELKEKNLKIDHNSLVPIINYYKIERLNEEAKKFIFEQTKNVKNIIVMNAIIDTLVESQPEIFVDEVEETILKTNFYDNITIASISKMFLNLDRMKEFKELIQKYDIKLTIDYYNTLISHCVSKRNFKEGIRIFKNLTTSTIEPDIVTRNIMMGLYLENGNVMEALKVWNQISSPNQRSYFVVINGLFLNEHDDLAFQVFESMDIKPSLELKNFISLKRKILEKKKKLKLRQK